MIGASVHTPNNEEKGKIKDLMISGDGRVEYAAVSFGGFLGMGNKLFAVPLDAIHIEWKDNKVNYATVDVSEESIKQRQGFDEKNWPQQADRGFLTNGGVTPRVRNNYVDDTPTTTTTRTTSKKSPGDFLQPRPSRSAAVFFARHNQLQPLPSIRLRPRVAQQLRAEKQMKKTCSQKIFHYELIEIRHASAGEIFVVAFSTQH